MEYFEIENLTKFLFYLPPGEILQPRGRKKETAAKDCGTRGKGGLGGFIPLSQTHLRISKKNLPPFCLPVASGIFYYRVGFDPVRGKKSRIF